MHYFMVFLLVAVGTFDFLIKLKLLPSVFGYVPELGGAVALVYVAVMGARTQFRYVPPLVGMILCAIAVVMICGVILNGVPSGAIFAGLRNYLRAIPLLLLPMVMPVSDRQLATYLRILLALCLVQLPIAVVQKMQPHVSGDAIFGTLMLSSFLSIFLICAACVVIGFYLRGRIRLPLLILLLVIILTPTTINETKGTLVLMPIALVTTFILGARPGTRIKNALIASGLLAACVMTFVAVYDYTQRDKPYRSSIVDFYTGESAGKYLESGKGFSTNAKDIKRMDAIKLSYAYLSTDPMKVAFGLGMGNASRSSLGPLFEGQYTRLFAVYMFLSGVRIMTELGILGLSLVILLMLSVFREAYRVARDDRGPVGALAAGWLGVIMVMLPALFYKDVISSNGISFIFWFLAGIVVARRMRLAHDRVAAQPPLPRVPGPRT